MLHTIKETAPLIQKSEKIQRTSRCTLITLASFVLIMVGLGVYFSGAMRRQSSISVESTLTHSEEDAEMKLKYMEQPFYAGPEPETPQYKGAVLEYETLYNPTTTWTRVGKHYVKSENPVTSKEEAQYWQDINIARITPYVEEAASKSVDILVLSEFALNGLVFTKGEMAYYLETVPNPADCIDKEDKTACTPCGNADFTDRSTLQQLSCLSKDNKINLVVNYGDIVEDGSAQYNTQLVFDYNGVIIARYYKIHTYKEDEYDVPVPEDPTSFTITLPTDETKTVTFGIIICYDSMYGSPLLQLVKDEGITNFVMSHWWVNTAPSMNIAQWTQAVSKTYGINLLVAASWWHNEDVFYNTLTEYGARDSSGSGVYSKGVAVLDENGVRQDYYDQNSDEHIGVLLMGDLDIDVESNAAALPSFPGYITTSNIGNACEESAILGPVNPLYSPGKTYEKTLSCPTSGFSCTAKATIKEMVKKSGTDTKKNWIWMYIFDGYYETADGGGVYYYESFCTIAVCDENCYYKAIQGDTTRTKFESIEVSANFGEDATLFVLSGDDTAKSVQDVEYKIEADQDKPGNTKVCGANVDKVLLNLSVMGRVFNKDTKVSN